MAADLTPTSDKAKRIAVSTLVASDPGSKYHCVFLHSGCEEV